METKHLVKKLDKVAEIGSTTLSSVFMDLAFSIPNAISEDIKQIIEYAKSDDISKEDIIIRLKKLRKKLL